MSSYNIGGQEIDLDLPTDAIITGAILITTYQRLDGNEIGAGTHWGYSSMPHVQAVGMMRLASNAIESVGDYT